jgi:hypothetical protein
MNSYALKYRLGDAPPIIRAMVVEEDAVTERLTPLEGRPSEARVAPPAVGWAALGVVD